MSAAILALVLAGSGTALADEVADVAVEGGAQPVVGTPVESEPGIGMSADVSAVPVEVVGVPADSTALAGATGVPEPPNTPAVDIADADVAQPMERDAAPATEAPEAPAPGAPAEVPTAPAEAPAPEAPAEPAAPDAACI